jgi:hypothetical protein
MMLHVDDTAFVRAPLPLLLGRLSDLDGWPRWWPGMVVRRMPTADGSPLLALELRRDPLRALRLAVVPHAHRPDHGFQLRLSGDLVGRAEFWLDPVATGTVVHHLLAADATRDPVRSLRTYRAVVRRGLWGLKDRVEVEVRTELERQP